MTSPMLQHWQRYRREWLTAAALAGLTLLTFLPAIDCNFVDVDDPDYVTKNPDVRAGLSAKGVQWAFTTFTASNWHPLTWLSLMADASLWGSDPHGFHRTSVLLHAANAAVLFLALRALTGAFWRSAAVALLFAVHPLRAESVAWVAERKDVLSAFFGFLALWAYAAYARRPSVPRYLAVAAALALSLLSKPMFVTLPCLFLVLDWWPLRRTEAAVPKPPPTTKGAVTAAAPPPPAGRSWRRLALEKLPLFVLVAASSAVTFQAQQESAVRTASQVPVALRVENALASYGAYLWMTAWPADLAVYYPHPIQDRRPGGGLSGGAVGAAAVLLLAATAAAVALRKRAPYLLTGWLWYLGTLVPVIGLVQVGDQAYADRYTYFPQIGILLAVCWGAADLAGAHARVALAAGAVAAVALAGATWNQLAVWKDSVTLWQHDLKVTYPTMVAETNLGVALEQERKYDEAARCYREALKIDPNNARCHINMGNILFIQKDFAGALRHLEEANRLAPGRAEILCNLGRIEAVCGRPRQALEHLQDAVDRKPDYPEAHMTLGMVLLQAGQLDTSVAHLRRAAELDPASAPAHDWYGMALEARGDRAAAAREYEQAVNLDPAGAQYQAHLKQIRGGPPNAGRAAPPAGR